MMSSSSSKKICFNPDCKDVESEKRFKKGWRLRTGDSAELCQRCSSAYEEGRYCDTFHAGAAGWRSCESCGKRVHCGCIVSVHAFVLLDAGGVDCMGCARKNIMMASNQMFPSSVMLPLQERVKDSSVKGWNPVGPSSVPGQWHQRHNIWSHASAQPELLPRMPYETNGEKIISGEHSSTTSLDMKKLEDPPQRVTSSSLNIVTLDRVVNGNTGIDSITGFHNIHRKEGNLDGLHCSRSLSTTDSMDARKGAISDSGLDPSVLGMGFEARPNPSANILLQSSTSKNDLLSRHFGLSVPFPLDEANEPSRVAGTSVQQQQPSPLPSTNLYHNINNGVESSAETDIHNGRPRMDPRGRNQLHSRYWPRITDQELQQISGHSNAIITPLFEKILSASDAGRIGRLVLPKKCAEAYFPAISQPEGLPLRVQDVKGKEWVFQFRFWPNNNSRMYVLEGVTPCIQSMQLQAGDIVTFSRLDPEGKLVMGFRKASNTDQDNPESKVGNSVSKNGEVNAKRSKTSDVLSTAHPLKGHPESTGYSLNNQVNSADPASWADKSSYIAKELQGSKSSLLSSKRKSSTLGSKSKRLHMENEDSIQLKLTWEEAQGLLRPPSNNVPSIVVIEGHEFEEYEEAPILGRPTIFATNSVGEKIQWAQCEDCSKWRRLPADALLPSKWTCSDNSWDSNRSSCSAAEELTTEQLEDLVSTVNASKNKAMKKDSDSLEVPEGLDTLVNLAILERKEVLTPTQQTTTRHPRHRPGCTCIVCIQPPSGKGPKHKDDCPCTVCLTVRRRFRTLMERREKRQSEKEAEIAEKKQQQSQSRTSEKPKQENEQLISSNNTTPTLKVVDETAAADDSNEKKMAFSPFIGGIDLNMHPDRDDEPSVNRDAGEMTGCEQLTAAGPEVVGPELATPKIDVGEENIDNGVIAGEVHLDVDTTKLRSTSTSATG